MLHIHTYYSHGYDTTNQSITTNQRRSQNIHTYPFESHSGLLRTAFHMSNISPAFSRRSPIA